MRIGLIGRADPTGLGSMTIDFCAEMPVAKALIVERHERGKTDATLVRCAQKLVVNEALGEPIWGEPLDWILDRIDVLVGFETFYADAVIPEAHRRGIKTVMLPMWECSPDQVHGCDVLFALSDTDALKYGNSVRTRWPMRRQKFSAEIETSLVSRRKRQPRIKFMPGGLHDRNNFSACCGVAEDLWQSLGYGEMRPHQFVEDRDEVFWHADLLVHLQAFDGLSLPILEATAAGVPVVVLDIPGFSGFAQAMRVRAGDHEEHEIGGRKVIYHRPDPVDLKRVLVELMAGLREPELGPAPATWDEFREVWEQVVKVG